MMRNILFQRATAVHALLWFVAALAATQAGLVGLPGYESAVATGLLSAVLTGPWALVLLRRTMPSWRRDSRVLVRLVASLAGVAALQLLVPIAVLGVNAAIRPSCEPLFGVLLIALIGLPAQLFTIALAGVLARLRRSIVAYAAYALVVAALLAHAVLTVYTHPQLFVYNHLFGVFIGFSWDEAQPLVATLAVYRIVTLAWALLLVTVAAVLAGFPRRHTLLAALPAVLLIMGAHIAGDRLGFSTSDTTLRRTLGGEHHSTHCIIHYDTTSFTFEQIVEVGRVHDSTLEEVSRTLGVSVPRVRSHIYPDRSTKRKLLGTETSQIARPWSAQIHLDAANWRDALAHELVHVAAAEFGPPLFRTPVLRTYGLTEGLAMAVAEDPGPRTLHQQAAAMLHYGMLPSLTTILSTTGFLSGNPSLGYVASGSFCRWIIDTHGMPALRTMYAADDVRASGRDPQLLDLQWRWLLRLERRVEPDSLATLYAFRAPALFRKICPRTRTELHRAARIAVLRGDAAEAVRLYRKAELLSPNPRAALGLADAMLRTGAYDSVLAYSCRLLADTSRAYSVLPLLLWMGDAAFAKGERGVADSCYRVLLEERLPGWPADSARVKLEKLEKVRDAGSSVYP
jgi:hypothetical protein